MGLVDELVIIPGWGPRVIVIGPLILSYGSPWALLLPIISGFLAGVNPEGGGCLPGLWKKLLLLGVYVYMCTCAHFGGREVGTVLGQAFDFLVAPAAGSRLPSR